LSLEDIGSIVIPSVVGIGGVLGGIWVGQHLSDRRENQKASEELRKLEYLLNADLTLINRMNLQALENIPILEKIVDDMINIIPEIPNNDKFVEYFAGFRFAVYDFTYWDSIMANGILIKLSEHDLRFITTVHKKVSDTIKIQTNGFAKFGEGLYNLAFASNESEINKTNNIKTVLKAHLNSMKRAHNSIDESIIHIKNNISWVDLTIEPIQEFKEDGPKMIVDSKGTYSFE
jgi:hypothetical protein